MTDLATANRLDDLLHDYFKPGPSPDGLARRVLGARRRDAEELAGSRGASPSRPRPRA